MPPYPAWPSVLSFIPFQGVTVCNSQRKLQGITCLHSGSLETPRASLRWESFKGATKASILVEPLRPRFSHSHLILGPV